MIFKEEEIGTPLHAVTEALVIVLCQTVQDDGCRCPFVTTASFQLYQHCIPPTLGPRKYQGLNTAFSLRQGIPRYRFKKLECHNCHITREEKNTDFVYARAGENLTMASYWCTACFLYWYNYGEVRPRRTILKNKTPKPPRCPDCLEIKDASYKGWCWCDSKERWYCGACHKKTLYVPAPSSVIRDSYQKPKRCPGCNKLPAHFKNPNGWQFDYGFLKWWCRSCWKTEESGVRVRDPEIRQRMKGKKKPKACPKCGMKKGIKGANIHWRVDPVNLRWICAPCFLRQFSPNSRPRSTTKMKRGPAKKPRA